MSKYVYGNWNDPESTNLEWKELGPYARRFAIPGSACTICVNMIKLYKPDPNAPERPQHSHEHEQIMLITQGDGEVIIDGEAFPMSSGSFIVIPPNVPHKYNATNATMDIFNIDIFTPRREEFHMYKEGAEQ